MGVDGWGEVFFLVFVVCSLGAANVNVFTQFPQMTSFFFSSFFFFFFHFFLDNFTLHHFDFLCSRAAAHSIHSH